MKQLTPSEFKKQIIGKTIIGHSGHRDLLTGDIQKIREKVKGKLEEIVKGTPDKFILITGNAEGADELVMVEALNLNIPVIILTILQGDFPGFAQGDEFRVDNMIKTHSNNLVKAVSLKGLKSFNKSNPYLIIRDVLAINSDHLILIWDGINTGKTGGVWDVSASFLNGPDDPTILPVDNIKFQHHLFARRKLNGIPSASAYFDRIIFPRNIYSWETSQRLSKSSGLYIRAVSAIRGFLETNFPDSTGLFLRSIIPLILGCIVLIFGIIGYISYHNGNPYGNALFFSINLITFNESVFDNDYNWSISIARVAGFLLAVNGFFIALYFASGKENLDRIFFRIKRNSVNNKFVVVIGLNEMGFDITKDLRANNPVKKRTSVVILDSMANESLIKLARKQGAWVISGDPTNPLALKKTHFTEAEQVFIVTGSEEENVRCVMEMDQVVSRNKKSSTEDWFVHIQDRKFKQLLQQSISARTNYALTVFSHSDNTARRMLAGFPELRETSLTTSIAIVGFGSVGKALTLKSLQQLVFTKTPAPRVIVFYTETEIKAVEGFKSEYPYLFPPSIEGIKSPFKKLTDWTFFEGFETEGLTDRILFFPLPIIPQPLTHPQSPLLKNVYNYGKLKVFACLPTGLESASFMTAILPGLELIKLRHSSYDIQAYCFYNFPDVEEEAYLEQKLNALAPHIPVNCFGNYLYEFSCKAIQNREADHLAKQIALWYYLLYDYGLGPQSFRRSMEIDERFTKIISRIKGLQNSFVANDAKASYEEIMIAKIEGLKKLWHQSLIDNQILSEMREMMRFCWKSLSETDREGNRQAADHLWVKVTEFDKSWTLSDRPSDIQSFRKFWAEYEIEELGVVEHRRWNTMKILDGWRPFEGKDWKDYKENYKAQKLHNLLVSFKDLPENEQVKDYHQIEGIPYYIALLYKDQYKNDILLN